MTKCTRTTCGCPDTCMSNTLSKPSGTIGVCQTTFSKNKWTRYGEKKCSQFDKKLIPLVVGCCIMAMNYVTIACTGFVVPPATYINRSCDSSRLSLGQSSSHLVLDKVNSIRKYTSPTTNDSRFVSKQKISTTSTRQPMSQLFSLQYGKGANLSMRSSSMFVSPSLLNMHMFHSHSHDHAGADETISNASYNNSKKTSFHMNRFQVARFLFAAIATLVIPALIRRRCTTTKVDVMAFALTSSVLAISGRIRKSSKKFIAGIMEFRRGLLRHAKVQAGDTAMIGGHDHNHHHHLDGDAASIAKQDKLSRKEAQMADRVTYLGVIVNVLLSGTKLVGGYMFHSAALVADAGHSLSDLVSDFVTLWAVRIGRLPPDEDHPYGHGKFEAVGSLSVSVLLLLAGFGIGAGSYSRLIEVLLGKAQDMAIPTAPALIVAALSVISKEWLYRVTHRVGQRIRSPVVMANAWHHRSDAYSSILALASIFVAITVPGMLAVDSAAGLLVAGMICTTGVEIFVDAMKQLTDTANTELVEQVHSVLREEMDQLDSVKGRRRVRARQVGSSSLVDVAVTLEDGLSVDDTRTIEERIRKNIMSQNPGVLDADVHARPYSSDPPVSSTTTPVPTLTQTPAMKSESSGQSALSSNTSDASSSPETVLQQSIERRLLDRDEITHVSNIFFRKKANSDELEASAAVVLASNEKGKYDAASLGGAEELIKELRQGIVSEEEKLGSLNIYIDLNRQEHDNNDAMAKKELTEESIWM